MLTIDLTLLERVADIAKRAGAQILTVYKTDFEVETKGDNSPVTQADQLAEALITQAIQSEISADIPIVGEEAVEAEGLKQPNGPLFWLVDPLDGTKEFVKRSGEFTVNIALIENGRPVLGVVHLPVLNETFVAGAPGAFKQTGDGPPTPIASREAPAEGLTAVVSRSHGAEEADAFLERYTVAHRIGAGSSLKFCRVAEGAADIYPRFGRTMEWDTAAGHAVLNFAGGRVLTTDGAPLAYGKIGLENPHFIAVGKGIGLDG
ncbi:MAG TPA: 3'(2'),5'-bisphosphate nucleotidase [Rhodospirillaceae bacterium]|nr:3'(2'),5'-bisphosphate nucleotidase [Magnetovibrio sp.]HBT41734.1 3'(2'),5'-bisphosphate nucleotidase [Rhodospirillaceae bacterium]